MLIYRFPIVEPDSGHTKLRLSREGLEAIRRIKTPIAAISVCHYQISELVLKQFDLLLVRSCTSLYWYNTSWVLVKALHLSFFFFSCAFYIYSSGNTIAYHSNFKPIGHSTGLEIFSQMDFIIIHWCIFVELHFCDSMICIFIKAFF